MDWIMIVVYVFIDLGFGIYVYILWVVDWLVIVGWVLNVDYNYLFFVVNGVFDFMLLV